MVQKIKDMAAATKTEFNDLRQPGALDALLDWADELARLEATRTPEESRNTLYDKLCTWRQRHPPT